MIHADFSGKVAVVTGGSGALCSQICRALALAGAKVAVLGSRQETADKAAEEIRAAGGQALAVACNVLDEESIRQAEQQIYQSYGQYHILINGAGIAPAQACTTREYASLDALDVSPEQENTLFNLSAQAVGQVMDLNCLGMFLSTRVFAKRMAGVEGACILNISSMSALSPLTKQIAYSASKAAVNSLTQWLATYLAPVGIRVNAIAPGYFKTAINKDAMPAEREQRLLARIPKGHMGTPSDLRGAAVFLSAPASEYVTGIVLPVDGGFLSR